MLKESEVLFQVGNFWVKKALFGTGRFKPKSQGFEVYECGVTCSTRKAIIGYSGELGFKMAKEKALDLFIEVVNGKNDFKHLQASMSSTHTNSLSA
jgi:hypothetical protein